MQPSAAHLILLLLTCVVLGTWWWNATPEQRRRRTRRTTPARPVTTAAPRTVALPSSAVTSYRCVCEANGAIAPKSMDCQTPIRVFRGLEQALSNAQPEVDYVVGGSRLHPLFYVVRVHSDCSDPVVPLGPPDSRVWVRTV